MSFHSSVSKLGKLVTQKIHFSGGNERTYNGIITSTIRQDNGFTQMVLTNGMMLLVNTGNVNSIRTSTLDCISFDEEEYLTKFEKVRSSSKEVTRTKKILDILDTPSWEELACQEIANVIKNKNDWYRLDGGWGLDDLWEKTQKTK